VPVGSYLDVDFNTGELSYFDGAAFQPIAAGGDPTELFLANFGAGTNPSSVVWVDYFPTNALVLEDGDYTIAFEALHLLLNTGPQGTFNNMDLGISVNGADPLVGTQQARRVANTPFDPQTSADVRSSLVVARVSLTAGDTVNGAFKLFGANGQNTAAVLQGTLRMLKVA
jgi:hypothetical protein